MGAPLWAEVCILSVLWALCWPSIIVAVWLNACGWCTPRRAFGGGALLCIPIVAYAICGVAFAEHHGPLTDERCMWWLGFPSLIGAFGAFVGAVLLPAPQCFRRWISSR